MGIAGTEAWELPDDELSPSELPPLAPVDNAPGPPCFGDDIDPI